MLSTDQFLNRGLGIKQTSAFSSDLFIVGLEKGTTRHYLTGGGSLFSSRSAMRSYLARTTSGSLAFRERSNRLSLSSYHLMYTKTRTVNWPSFKNGNLGYAIKLSQYSTGQVRGYAEFPNKVDKYAADLVTRYNLEAGLVASYLLRTRGKRYNVGIEFRSRLLFELPQVYRVVITEMKSNARAPESFHLLEQPALNLYAGIYLWNILTLVAPNPSTPAP